MKKILLQKERDDVTASHKQQLQQPQQQQQQLFQTQTARCDAANVMNRVNAPRENNQEDDKVTVCVPTSSLAVRPSTAGIPLGISVSRGLDVAERSRQQLQNTSGRPLEPSELKQSTVPSTVPPTYVSVPNVTNNSQLDPVRASSSGSNVPGMLKPQYLGGHLQYVGADSLSNSGRTVSHPSMLGRPSLQSDLERLYSAQLPAAQSLPSWIAPLGKLFMPQYAASLHASVDAAPASSAKYVDRLQGTDDSAAGSSCPSIVAEESTGSTRDAFSPDSRQGFDESMSDDYQRADSYTETSSIHENDSPAAHHHQSSLDAFKSPASVRTNSGRGNKHHAVKATVGINSWSAAGKSSAAESSASGGGRSIIRCPICSKLFNNSSALAKHKLTHSDERKYTCHTCSKSFKRQDHLNGHMMTHSSKKPFECKFIGCTKSYCDARSLRRHLENHHQDFMNAINTTPASGIPQPVVSGDHHAVYQPEAQRQENGGGNAVMEVEQRRQQAQSPFDPKLIWTTGCNPLDEPRPVKCHICDRGFKNIAALNGHMRLHGGYIRRDNPDGRPETSEHADVGAGRGSRTQSPQLDQSVSPYTGGVRESGEQSTASETFSMHFNEKMGINDATNRGVPAAYGRMLVDARNSHHLVDGQQKHWLGNGDISTKRGHSAVEGKRSYYQNESAWMGVQIKDEYPAPSSGRIERAISEHNPVKQPRYDEPIPTQKRPMQPWTRVQSDRPSSTHLFPGGAIDSGRPSSQHSAISSSEKRMPQSLKGSGLLERMDVDYYRNSSSTNQAASFYDAAASSGAGTFPFMQMQRNTEPSIEHKMMTFKQEVQKPKRSHDIGKLLSLADSEEYSVNRGESRPSAKPRNSQFAAGAAAVTTSLETVYDGYRTYVSPKPSHHLFDTAYYSGQSVSKRDVEEIVKGDASGYLLKQQQTFLGHSRSVNSSAFVEPENDRYTSLEDMGRHEKPLELCKRTQPAKSDCVVTKSEAYECSTEALVNHDAGHFRQEKDKASDSLYHRRLKNRMLMQVDVNGGGGHCDVASSDAITLHSPKLPIESVKSQEIRNEVTMAVEQLSNSENREAKVKQQQQQRSFAAESSSPRLAPAAAAVYCEAGSHGDPKKETNSKCPVKGSVPDQSVYVTESTSTSSYYKAKIASVDTPAEGTTIPVCRSTAGQSTKPATPYGCGSVPVEAKENDAMAAAAATATTAGLRRCCSGCSSVGFLQVDSNDTASVIVDVAGRCWCRSSQYQMTCLKVMSHPGTPVCVEAGCHAGTCTSAKSQTVAAPCCNTMIVGRCECGTYAPKTPSVIQVQHGALLRDQLPSGGQGQKLLIVQQQQQQHCELHSSSSVPHTPCMAHTPCLPCDQHVHHREPSTPACVAPRSCRAVLTPLSTTAAAAAANTQSCQFFQFPPCAENAMRCSPFISHACASPVVVNHLCSTPHCTRQHVDEPLANIQDNQLRDELFNGRDRQRLMRLVELEVEERLRRRQSEVDDGDRQSLLSANPMKTKRASSPVEPDSTVSGDVTDSKSSVDNEVDDGCSSSKQETDSDTEESCSDRSNSSSPKKTQKRKFDQELSSSSQKMPKREDTHAEADDRKCDETDDDSDSDVFEGNETNTLTKSETIIPKTTGGKVVESAAIWNCGSSETSSVAVAAEPKELPRQSVPQIKLNGSDGDGKEMLRLFADVALSGLQQQHLLTSNIDNDHRDERRKQKPQPLVIPPTIDNRCGNASASALSAVHQSWLRSPRLHSSLVTLPYTPPPILSPTRSGRGLFWTQNKVSTPASAVRQSPLLPNFDNQLGQPSPRPTDSEPHINVGPKFQAELPQFNADRTAVYKMDENATLVWHPTIAKKVHKHAVDLNSQYSSAVDMADGWLSNSDVADSEQLQCNADMKKAAKMAGNGRTAVPIPSVLKSSDHPPTDWKRNEVLLFQHAILKYDKDFCLISRHVGSRTSAECVQYYYVWKKMNVEEYRRLRTLRRRREQAELYQLRSTSLGNNK